MNTNNKFTLGLLMIVIALVFGIVLLSVLDMNIAEARAHLGMLPITFKDDVPVWPYPLPTPPPTPDPYPSPSPSPMPSLIQYLPILFDNIMENLFDK